MNNLETWNEYAFLVISMHQIAFTDFATDAQIKNMMGWSFVACSVANLVFPNLYQVIVNLWPELRETLRCRKPVKN